MTYLEEEVKKFNDFLNIPYPYDLPIPDRDLGSDPEKILVLSDPHEPYAHEPILEYAADAERDASICVIPGDLGDYYSKSRFKKNRAVSFRDELRAVFFRLEWLSSRWHTVLVMIGNHDNRPEKKLGDLIGDNVELQLLTETNLLKRIASYFPNVQIVGQQLGGSNFQLTHIFQMGDLIFTHGEISRVQKTATLEYISKYLHAWAPVIGLKPYRVIAQAHNHTDLKTSVGEEKWFMLPTCSDPYSIGMEYIYHSRMVGRPPSLGYSVFYQKDGVTDYNKSHNTVFEYGSTRKP